jgi:hypothetical protein
MRLGYHRKVPLEFLSEPPSGAMSKTKRAPQGEIPGFYHKIPVFYLGCGLESFPRENHADKKYPLSGKRCAARAHTVSPWGAILDFARWRAGKMRPNSRGLVRFGS